MTVEYADPANTALLNQLNTLANAGAGPAVAYVLSNFVAKGATKTGILATAPLSDPAFSLSGNTLSLNAVASVNGSATGVPLKVVVEDSDGNFVTGWKVGGPGSKASDASIDVECNPNQVTAGQAVNFNNIAIALA